PTSESLIEALVQAGTDDQIRFASPILQHQIQTIDVRIVLWAQTNTRYLSKADPGKVALLQQARRPFLKTFLERTASKSLRWCGTQFPTHAAAQDAEMSLSQYEDFVYRAGLLHLPDPVAQWRAIHERQERVRDYLQGKRTLRFRAP